MEFKEIGRRLKLVRKSLGLRQKEFAQKVNISVTTLSDMETGKSRAGFDFLYNIVKIFNFNLYYIFFEEGDMFNDNKNHPNKEVSICDSDDEDVQEFLWYLLHSKYVKFNVLAWFRKFYNQEEAAIKQDLDKGKNKSYNNKEKMN
jgi:transcriptional regulator with XRE-family HTH domain